MSDLLNQKVDQLASDLKAIREPRYDLAWSSKVPPEFTARVTTMAAQLQLPKDGADWLMSVMAFESARTFSPTIKNGAGAPYYGLIQFGAAAAKDIGTTLPDLLKMTQMQQLEYVYKYFKPLTGKLKTLSDLYMKILWPVGVGKSEDYVLWDKATRPTTYLQNRGLDLNVDGKITKAEVSSKLAAVLVDGLKTANRRRIV